MENEIKLYLSKLKKAGKSDTKSRMSLFKVFLSRNHKPISPAELANLCEPEIDRSTVYRNIETLEKIGIIKKISVGWRYKLELSEEFHGHHHHLTCIDCGSAVVPTNNQKLERLIEEIAKNANFKATDHQFEIRGYCKDCC